ncbi:phosphoglycerate kinase, partial [Candidatus Dojkabacteria bacterium]|nr:phosphoglycerate kinase [Candidatus Dojkabacteria bacterium]
KAPDSYTVINSQAIPKGKWAVDVGPKTVELFKNEIGRARSILWNGPLGVLEWDIIGSETRDIAQAMVKNSEAFSLVGGGDSIAAINKFQVDGFNHISTGGGAMLAFLAYDSFSTLDVLLRE